MIQTSRLLYADSVMCALAVAAIARIIAYPEHGGWKRLATAAGLVGLATGAKYPAALLLIPLGIACWGREPNPRAFRPTIISIAIVGLTFLCTTPYLLFSWPEFARDAVFIGDTTSGGQLGKLSGPKVSYYLAAVGHNVGWLGLSLMAISLANAVRHSSTSPRLLWISWLVLFLPIAVVPVEADRYLVPVVAVSAVLAAAGAAPMLGPLRGVLTPLAGAGLVVIGAQPAWQGIRAAMAGHSTTQREARCWCEAHLRKRTCCYLRRTVPTC